jgi:hypothetical protein
MSYLSREKQIEIIAALCEGVGQRAVARRTDTDRKTVARLALRVGRGAAELHDRMMVGVRTSRLELDELWAFMQRSRRWHQKPGLDGPVTRGSVHLRCHAGIIARAHFLFDGKALNRKYGHVHSRQRARVVVGLPVALRTIR